MTQYSAVARDDYKRCVCFHWGNGAEDCPQGEDDKSNEDEIDNDDESEESDQDDDGKLSYEEIHHAMEEFIESDATEYGYMLKHDEL